MDVNEGQGVWKWRLSLGVSLLFTVTLPHLRFTASPCVVQYVQVTFAEVQTNSHVGSSGVCDYLISVVHGSRTDTDWSSRNILRGA